MKKVVNAVIRIEYDDEFNTTTSEELDDIAIDLSLNPNFHTVEQGVLLKSVHLLKVEPSKPIDWDGLRQNPDLLCIKA